MKRKVQFPTRKHIYYRTILSKPAILFCRGALIRQNLLNHLLKHNKRLQPQTQQLIIHTQDRIKHLIPGIFSRQFLPELKAVADDALEVVCYLRLKLRPDPEVYEEHHLGEHVETLQPEAQERGVDVEERAEGLIVDVDGVDGGEFLAEELLALDEALELVC